MVGEPDPPKDRGSAGTYSDSSTSHLWGQLWVKNLEQAQGLGISIYIETACDA